MLKKPMIFLILFIFIGYIHISTSGLAESGISHYSWEYIGDRVKFSNFIPKNNSYIDTTPTIITWSYYDNESAGSGEILQFKLSITIDKTVHYLLDYNASMLGKLYMNIEDLPTQYTIDFNALGIKLGTKVILYFWIRYEIYNRSSGGIPVIEPLTNSSYYCINYFNQTSVPLVDMYPYMYAGIGITMGTLIVYYIYIRQKKEKTKKQVFRED